MTRYPAKRMRWLVAGAALGVVLIVPATALAQRDRSDSTLAAATALRASGKLSAAIAQLQPYVARNPSDVGAARLLAETLYWMKNSSAAREVYEAALTRHPNDAALRLEFSRMLAETGDGSRARAVLRPLLGRSRGRAEAQLGTLAYWEGDLSGARSLFELALQADPTQAEPRRQLGEIATAAAPWVTAEFQAAHDDQPLDRRGAMLEAGWYPAPASTVFARASTQQYGDPPAGLAVATAALGATHYAAALHLESDATAGVLRRSSATPVDWIGQIGVGYRLPRHLALRARAQREGYFHTLASLTTPVMTRTGTALLALTDAQGWLGELAVQRQWFPDANAMSTAYVWLLAPILRGTGGSLLLGAGASAQNADQSRFVLANRSQPLAVTDPQFRSEGRYSPYYTPSNLRTQSALASITITPVPSVALRIRGSYGVSARENAPGFQVIQGSRTAPASLVMTSEPRSFSPWTAHGALEIGSAGGLRVALTGDAMRTAFYQSLTGGLRVTYRFGTAGRSRADGY